MINNDSISYFSQFNALTGNSIPCKIKTDWYADVIYKENNVLLIGGDFSIFNFKERNNAFAMDLNDFRLLNWNPKTDDLPVKMIKINKAQNVVYLLPSYGSSILYAVDDKYGNIIPELTITTDVPVNDFAIDQVTGKIYIAGSFNVVNGENKSYLAAIGQDGSLLPFEVDIDNNVEAITIGENTRHIYFGGHFNEVNGVERWRLASVDTSGTLLSWYPKIIQFINYKDYPSYLMSKDDIIFITGDYYKINTIRVPGNSPVDDVTGEVIPWELHNYFKTGPQVQYESFKDGMIVSSWHNNRTDRKKGYMTYIEPQSGKLIGTIPNIGLDAINDISDYESKDSILIMGGPFMWLNGKYHPFLAFLSIPDQLDIDTSLLNFSSSVQDSLSTSDTVSMNDTTSIIISNDLNQKNNMAKIYPNPFHDQFYIDFSEPINSCTISLMDISGKILEKNRHENIYNQRIKLNLKDEPRGIYFVRIQTQSKNKTFLVIKK